MNKASRFTQQYSLFAGHRKLSQRIPQPELLLHLLVPIQVDAFPLIAPELLETMVGHADVFMPVHLDYVACLDVSIVI